ncbi:hypothetical protein Tdes44962_MAKER04756 [Teratosphaeria destructans]|uniref:Uncharacterized protein n=1 Tax=Teratosphaeria destructans TaxID=418781 RepID=A0A9W7SLH2_9PEZI|nr:hypothetical protein Tdes44962_MAKER04756 [Teratosphaeria destructans]
MAALQILVQAIPLGNQLLLPLPESLLFDLDLLCESLPERLLLFLELGVIQLPRPCLAKLPRLHLLRAVCFVVVLFSRVDEVKHVRADENGAQLLEIAVLLVLDFSDTPGVLTSLDSATIRRGNVALGADDGERHGRNQGAGVLETSLVVFLERRLVNLDALRLNHSSDLGKSVSAIFSRVGQTYAMLEFGKVRRRQRVSLGDDRDQIDTGAQPFHHFNVQRLQSVTGRADEVQAGVHTEVDLLGTAWLLLLKHVALVLVVQKLDDWLPAVAVVHVVSEAWGVDDGQADLEELLLQLGLGDFNLDGLVDLLRVTSAVVGVVLDGGGEEGIDEGGLAQARLAGHHDGEGGAALGHNLVALVGKLYSTSITIPLSTTGSCTHVGNANGTHDARLAGHV